MERKQGIVRVVAKNGGIKFEGEDIWYNPSDSIQESVTPEWKGKGVELELIAPNTFVGLREVNLLGREQLITRQVAIKAAAEFAKTGHLKTMDELFEAAEQIERWINR